MIRAITTAVLLLTAATSYGLYEVKYEVQRLEKHYIGLNRELLRDQEAIHVLKAEWSYLSRPERLQELSERFLALGPTDVAQIGTMDQIPARRFGLDIGPAAVVLKMPARAGRPQAGPVPRSGVPAAARAVDVVAELRPAR